MTVLSQARGHIHKLTILLLSIFMTLTAAMTVNAADNAMSSQDVLDLLHPVGSYYDTTSSTFNPNTAWGGTWEQETDGRVLIASNSTYTLGATGGEATHVLTPGETAMKAHSHTVDDHTHSVPGLSGYTDTVGDHTHTFYRNGSTAGNAGSNRYSFNGSTSYISTEAAGSHAHSVGTNGVTSDSSSPGTGYQNVTERNGSAHNNMQPYKAVNRWRRTA